MPAITVQQALKGLLSAHFVIDPARIGLAASNIELCWRFWNPLASDHMWIAALCCNARVYLPITSPLMYHSERIRYKVP
jgi:hypothetical protein